jgi:hemoglobin-like flavoprotein
MTTASLERICGSFNLLSPQMERMTRTFYARLFAARPETRALFKVNMDVQRQHLAAALALIVRNLPMFDALQEPLAELGASHAKVGVRPEHYPVVRDAMLGAIAEALGAAWTVELAADWRMLIETIASQMLAGTLGAGGPKAS